MSSTNLGGLLTRAASSVVNSIRLAGMHGHLRRIRYARRILRLLRTFEKPGCGSRCIAYLRNIDPAVFEELVLTALEDAGGFVLRNRRYTGDGGIDGRVWLPGCGWFAVQAKRYSSHVCADHVRSFALLVHNEGYGAGFFVHTGRSGAAVYANLRTQNVRLVSGDRLVQLLLRGTIDV